MSSPKPARETERVTARVCQAATHKHSLKTHGKPAPAPPDVKSSQLPGTAPRRGSARGTRSAARSRCGLACFPRPPAPRRAAEGRASSVPCSLCRCRGAGGSRRRVRWHACWHGVSDASAGKLTHTHLPAGHRHLHPGRAKCHCPRLRTRGCVEKGLPAPGAAPRAREGDARENISARGALKFGTERCTTPKTIWSS